MFKNVKPTLQKELKDIREAGLYKEERIIVTPQSAEIETDKGHDAFLLDTPEMLQTIGGFLRSTAISRGLET